MPPACPMPMPWRRPKNDPGNFHGKPLWQRAAVVAAGPIANFILAIFIFSAAFMTVGAPVMEPRVDEVLPGSAAEQAGIRKGDLIVVDRGPRDRELLATSSSR